MSTAANDLPNEKPLHDVVFNVSLTSMNNTELTYQGVDEPGILEFLSLVAEYNGRPAFTPTRYSNLIGLANTFRDLSIVIHALLHAHVAADNQQHISRNVYIDDDNELKAVFSVPRKSATTNKANLNIIVKTHTLTDRKEHNTVSHNGH